MTNQLSTVNSITIQAPAAKSPAIHRHAGPSRQWFFGVDTLADWQEGGPIVHKGAWQGKPYEDKGTILKVEPNKLPHPQPLDPVSGLPDLPENYQQVAWELLDRGGETRLTIKEVNLPPNRQKTSPKPAGKPFSPTLSNCSNDPESIRAFNGENSYICKRRLS